MKWGKAHTQERPRYICFLRSIVIPLEIRGYNVMAIPESELVKIGEVCMTQLNIYPRAIGPT